MHPTVEVTDEIRQDVRENPRMTDATAGYMVLDRDSDPQYFEYFERAMAFAERQMRIGGEKIWSVYPLYASHPIEVD